MSITLPYTFSNGTIADATQVNANFDSLNNRTQWVTPEMFGAVGDGVTDDTIAIQAAIDSLFVPGGEVRFASKVYRISDSIKAISNVNLIGTATGGWAASNPTISLESGDTPPYIGTWLIVASSDFSAMAGKPIINLANSRHQEGYLRNVVIKNLRMKPDTTDCTNNTIMGISSMGKGCSFIHIELCQTSTFGGYHIDIAGSVCTITYCRSVVGNSSFYRISSNTAPAFGSDNTIVFNQLGSVPVQNTTTIVKSGIVLESCGQNLIMGNEIFNCDCGIYLHSSAANRVIGNRCEKHSLYGIALIGGSRQQIEGNYLFLNRVAGITVSFNHESVVSGNFCSWDESSDYGGIYHGTAITYTQWYGIYLADYTRNCIISGNMINQPNQHGIYALGHIVGGTPQPVFNNSICNNMVYGAGKNNDGLDYIGIYLADYSYKNVINGNHVIDADTWRTKWGIRCDLGTNSSNTYNSITNNTATGAGTEANIVNAGDYGIMYNNIGDYNLLNASNVIAQTTTTLDLTLQRMPLTLINLPATTVTITSVLMPTAPTDGMHVTFRFKQGGTSVSSVSGWPGNVKFAGGVFSLTATINKSDTLTLTYSSRDNCWYEISRAMNQ